MLILLKISPYILLNFHNFSKPLITIIFISQEIKNPAIILTAGRFIK